MSFNDSLYNKDWTEVKISDYGKFARGVSKHRPRNDERLFYGGGYPLVQTSEIKDAVLMLDSHSQEYGEFGLKQSKLWDSGTLCITIAANIAESAIIAYPMCFPDSVVGFSADPEKTSETFVYYIFSSIRQAIKNSASGSSQDNINLDYLTSLEFKFPTKKEQDLIAGLLSNIDKKIIINKNTVSILRKTIEEIFDHYFLSFNYPNNNFPYKSSGGEMEYNKQIDNLIPKGWKVDAIKNVCRVSLGGTPSRDIKEYWEDGDIPWLNSGEIANFPITNSFEHITESGLANSATKLVRSGSVMVSITGNIRVSITAIDASVNQSVVCIEESEVLKNSYIYPYLEKMIPRYESKMTGNIQKHINKDVVANTYIVIPPNNVLQAYYDIASPMIERIISSSKEIMLLSKLRDWLLPMLMSGQVRITN